MKYTKNPYGNYKKYWVKIKKQGSKYWKVVPYETAIDKINDAIVKIKVGNTEHTTHQQKANKYIIVY